MRLNDQQLLTAQATELQRGNWTIEAKAKSDDEIVGAAIVEIGEETFTGTVLRGAVDGGTWSGKIEGGNGKLRERIQSRSYTAATVSQILSDILNDAGEKISPEIESSVLRRSLPHWARADGPADRAIKDLTDVLGVTWRVKRDGTIWIGTDRFQSVTVEHTKLSRGPSDSLVIAPSSPQVVPGDLFSDRKVHDVITSLTASRMTQEIYFQEGNNSGFAKVIERMLDRLIGSRLDYSASYPAKVVGQAGDGTLSVLIDHPRLRGDGLRSVPIRLGIPGASCEVVKGARVRIHFDEQNPSKPFAALWDTNPGDVTVISIGSGAVELARADKVDDEISRIWNVLTTWTVVAADGGGALLLAAQGAVLGKQSTACSTVKAK